MTEDNRQKPDPTRLDQLYRQAAHAEPDSRIDEAVLGKARRAASRTRRSGLRHPGAWGVGLAAAASLVLAVGLVSQYGWQPAPESDHRKQFRARAEMEQADEPSAPAADDSIRRRDAEEPAAIKESAELNRVQVTGARAPEEAGREDQESREAKVDETEMAAPTLDDGGDRIRPEVWLERIRDLSEAGQMESAREELHAFQETHPEVEIPQDLRELLKDGVP